MPIKHLLESGGEISFEVGPLQVDGQSLPPPVFHGDRAVAAGLELTRVVRPVARGIAVSLRLANRRPDPVRVRRLCPLRLGGGDALPGREDFARWHVFRMARQKNDIPGFFRPSVPDESMEDALFDSSEVAAGHGIGWADFGGDRRRLPRVFQADPAMIFFTGADRPPLFIGFIGQDRHLNEVILETSPDRTGLARLEAGALFDGARLEPGAVFTTHELLIREGGGLEELRGWFAEEVAALYRVPRPPAHRPTVFCSWYFYGSDFREADLHENLAELARRPVPCDIVQVDNGWMDNFGDWQANERFPSGLEAMARVISEAGCTPGIWTAPFVIDPAAKILAKYPDLKLLDAAGEPCLFKYGQAPLFVLDPCAPNAERYLAEMFGRLKALGFRYHKLDFVRSLVLNENARFADPAANRAVASRRGLEIIRRALGPECYIEVCGGLYEGSAGLADALRSSCDVKGFWADGRSRLSGYPVRIRQNVYRNHYNRLCHTDPDALQLRRREGPFRGDEASTHLSAGRFSDEEAFTIVVNHFLGGGLACFAERLVELDEDRRLLYRHAIPPHAPPATLLDDGRAGYCPRLFLTRFEAPGNGLGPWAVLTLANWGDEPEKVEVAPADLASPGGPGQPLACFEFRRQRFLGVTGPGQSMEVEVPARGTRLLRLTPVDRGRVLLLGTDCHLAQGMELEAWQADGRSCTGRLRGDWTVPVTLTLLFPGASAPVRAVVREPGDFRFTAGEAAR